MWAMGKRCVSEEWVSEWVMGERCESEEWSGVGECGPLSTQQEKKK